MALMGALSLWRDITESECHIFVVTVDHGLRPESAQEAAMVAAQAEKAGFDFRLLHWCGDKPLTGLQEAAREARYSLLTDFCHEAGVAALLTAHTRDDQAETMLMRMARGSGLSGLKGMSSVSLRDDVRHMRPFLKMGKERLIEACLAHGWPYVEDPSNTNERFTRVRWRELMPVLAREGLDAERLAALAERLARADEALDDKAEGAYALVDLTGEADSTLILDGHLLFQEPFEIILRVFLRALAHFGYDRSYHRLQRVENCVSAFREASSVGRALRRTISGTLISLDRGGKLVIEAEPVRKRGQNDDLRAEVASRRPSSLGKNVSNT